MKVIKEIQVNKDCKISNNNPTPSKKSLSTVLNIEAQEDLDEGFINFTLGAELEQQCCEDFKVIYPDTYKYDWVYVCNITVLSESYNDYESIIVNVLIRDGLYNHDNYGNLIFTVSNVTTYYGHEIYFSENDELIYNRLI